MKNRQLRQNAGAAQPKSQAGPWVGSAPAAHLPPSCPPCAPQRPWPCAPGRAMSHPRAPGRAPTVFPQPLSVSDTAAAAGKKAASAPPSAPRRAHRLAQGHGRPPCLRAREARRARGRLGQCRPRPENKKTPRTHFRSVPRHPAPPGPRRARVPLSGRAAAAGLPGRGVQTPVRPLLLSKRLFPKVGRRALGPPCTPTPLGPPFSPVL